MKAQVLSGIFLFGVMAVAPAALFTQGSGSGSGFDSGTAVGTLQNTTIVDGSPVGIWNTMDLSAAGIGGVLSTITVTLNVSGGNNSGLYAYLSYNGTAVTLLNRIGVGSANPFGNTSSGFNNITLNSTGSDIHTASGTLAGAYGADGRMVSPLSSAASFDAAGTVTLDGSFGGMNPNGQWTLFFADVASGGGNATLNGWSLEITAVPEPVNVAMAILALVFISGHALRLSLGSKKAHSSLPSPLD